MVIIKSQEKKGVVKYDFSIQALPQSLEITQRQDKIKNNRNYINGSSSKANQTIYL